MGAVETGTGGGMKGGREKWGYKRVQRRATGG